MFHFLLHFGQLQSLAPVLRRVQSERWGAGGQLIQRMLFCMPPGLVLNWVAGMTPWEQKKGLVLGEQQNHRKHNLLKEQIDFCLVESYLGLNVASNWLQSKAQLSCFTDLWEKSSTALLSNLSPSLPLSCLLSKLTISGLILSYEGKYFITIISQLIHHVLKDSD